MLKNHKTYFCHVVGMSVIILQHEQIIADVAREKFPFLNAKHVRRAEETDHWVV